MADRRSAPVRPWPWWSQCTPVFVHATRVIAASTASATGTVHFPNAAIAWRPDAAIHTLQAHDHQHHDDLQGVPACTPTWPSSAITRSSTIHALTAHRPADITPC